VIDSSHYAATQEGKSTDLRRITHLESEWKMQKISCTTPQLWALRRLRRVGERAAIILHAHRMGPSASVQKISEKTGHLPQMVRTWWTRWDEEVRADTDIGKFLVGNIHRGRSPNTSLTIETVKSVIRRPLPSGARAWTAALICAQLGITQGSPHYHTVRNYWRRIRKENLPNVPMRGYVKQLPEKWT
jgi:hypothetical protein